MILKLRSQWMEFSTSFKGYSPCQEDVVHGVEEVDEKGVVLGGGEVERLHEGELGHRRQQEEGVDDRHHRQDLPGVKML